MKTVYLLKLPECDYENIAPGCGGEAIYDAPTIHGGKWAHMCEHHYKMFKGIGADEIGCKLAIRKPTEPKNSEPVRGLEPGLDDFGYWENALWDGMREIECPDCGVTHNVEPDADYTYTCEGCGVRVKCPIPPM